MLNAKLIVLGLLLTQTLSAQYKGQVYIDQNLNKQLDEKELGFQGIRVSDGYDVVKTDSQGRFEIAIHPAARFLTVTIPSGYKATETHYQRIETNKQVYNFGLLKDENQEKDHLKFIQITDTESSLYGSWIDNIRNYAKNENAAVIVHTGDICYEPGMRFHAHQVNSALMGRSTYYSVGNHDLVKGEYGEKLFEDLFGPVYYSFEAGPAHFVVTPMPSGDYAPSYTQDQVIAWLKKDLALKDKDKPLIFINHNLVTGNDFVLKGKQETINLKDYNLKAYLYGHWHNNYAFGSKDDVLVISTTAPNKGGIDHSAAQFLVIDVDKKGVVNVLPKYTNLRDHAVLLPSANGINANVYDSEREVASVVAYMYDAAGNRKALANLRQHSNWNWRADLKPDKNENELLLEITYKDGSKTWKKQAWPNTGATASRFKLDWSNNIGAEVWKTSPIVHNNLLYTASIDDTGSGNSKIVAMDKNTGAIKWSFQTKNTVKHKLCYESGYILATDAGAQVYALDAISGKLQWTKDLNSGNILPSYAMGGVVQDGYYYTGMAEYLSAIRVKDGQVVWQNSEWKGGESTPTEMLIAKDYLVTGANWNAVFVHDKNTGKLVWKKNTDGLSNRSAGATAGEKGIYFAGLNSLFLIDPKSGDILKQKKTSEDLKVMGSPLLYKDQIILPNSTNGVKSYALDSFEERWGFKTGEALIYSAPYSSPDQHKPVATVESAIVPYGDYLLFGASDGYLYLLDAAGKLVDKVNLGAPILAEPSVLNSKVYVADFAGNVSCFSLD